MTLGSIDTFDLEARVGRGAMGAVFRAIDRRTDERVAIKILLPELSTDVERRTRFLREAKASAALHHQNIATVYDVGEVTLEAAAAHRLGLAGAEGSTTLPYLVLEFVSGQDIDHLMARGPQPIGRVIEWTGQMLDALEAAHAVGVIHRDLKPGNVRIDDEGRVKLLDFGLAKILKPQTDGGWGPLSTQLTLDGTVMGTLPYISPEQLQGNPVDGRADLFSLGVLVYELLTGAPPYPGNSMVEFARALLLSDLAPPSRHRQEIPSWLDDLVLQLLATEPEDRFAAVRDVRQAITEGCAKRKSIAPRWEIFRRLWRSPELW